MTNLILIYHDTCILGCMLQGYKKPRAGVQIWIFNIIDHNYRSPKKNPLSFFIYLFYRDYYIRTYFYTFNVRVRPTDSFWVNLHRNSHLLFTKWVTRSFVLLVRSFLLKSPLSYNNDQLNIWITEWPNVFRNILMLLLLHS